MSKKFLLITLAIPLLGLAEEGGPIRGPVAGFVFDRESRAIRPVLGVPGSSHLGSAILSDADAASIAPDGSAALATQQSRLIIARGIRTGSPEAVAVNQAIANADLFSWSRTAAVVYSSASRQAQIIRDLNATPSASSPIDFSGLPGVVSSIALHGDSIIAATEGGGVFLLSSGKTRLIAASQSPSAVALSGTDLYFADRDGGSIWVVRDFENDATAAVFATGIDSPVALFASAGRLFAASAGTRQLRTYDLASKAETASIDLEFTPSSFDFAGEPSLLIMARGISGEQPYYLLDASQNPAVFFVPAGREQ